MYRISTKLIGILLVAFVLESGAAVAQSTLAQQNACRPDVFRLCSSYIPDVHEIVACLRGNEARLSEPCRQVMFADHAETEGYREPSRARSSWDQ